MSDLTPKQEAFANAVASGMTQADAYRAAYNAGKMKPATIQRNASALMSNSKIATRVSDLRKPIAEKAQITLESHLKDLEKLRDSAKEARQFSAAISAEIARGKASGVAVDKSEVKTVVHSGVLKVSPTATVEDWGK